MDRPHSAEELLRAARGNADYAQTELEEGRTETAQNWMREYEPWLTEKTQAYLALLPALRLLVGSTRDIRINSQITLYGTRKGWIISPRSYWSSPLLCYDQSQGPLYSEGTRDLRMWSCLNHFVDVIRPELAARICFSLPVALRMIGGEWDAVASALDPILKESSALTEDSCE